MRKEFKPSFKFTKNVDLDNDYDTTRLIVYSDAETLPELLSDFLNFIRACGFSVASNATLEIENNE